MRFSRNPIYATLHESSYADGVATRWSAARLLPDESGRRATSRPSTSSRGCGRTTRASGRSGRPPRSWPNIPGRRSTTPTELRRNEVPVAATIYVNDLYVEREFAEETAATIRGLRPWVTNEFEHNGLRGGRRAGPRPADRPAAPDPRAGIAMGFLRRLLGGDPPPKASEGGKQT